jgi:hypothetical protein
MGMTVSYFNDSWGQSDVWGRSKKSDAKDAISYLCHYGYYG